MKRDPETNMFKSEELAKIIHDASEAPAGTFRANGTPLGKFFRLIADCAL